MLVGTHPLYGWMYTEAGSAHCRLAGYGQPGAVGVAARNTNRRIFRNRAIANSAVMNQIACLID
jgi:hypothetical protein